MILATHLLFTYASASVIEKHHVPHNTSSCIKIWIVVIISDKEWQEMCYKVRKIKLVSVSKYKILKVDHLKIPLGEIMTMGYRLDHEHTMNTSSGRKSKRRLNLIHYMLQQPVFLVLVDL